MRLIEPKIEVINKYGEKAVLQRLEEIGRVSHKSEDKITENSAEQFVKNLIKWGHESVLEHISITVKFTTDRAVSHQLVRHRLASYTQLSQRYVIYDNEISFILPVDTNKESLAGRMFIKSFGHTEAAYFALIKQGKRPEQARAVLPNATATEIYMTANLREWRHVLKLRTSKGADPEIKRIMVPLLTILAAKYPTIFKDIEESYWHNKGLEQRIEENKKTGYDESVWEEIEKTSKRSKEDYFLTPPITLAEGLQDLLQRMSELIPEVDKEEFATGGICNYYPEEMRKWGKWEENEEEED